MRTVTNKNIRFFIILSGILIVSSTHLFSTEKKKLLTFTVNDGLPRNMVTCFVQDKYGYGWVGTRNGLARFDGYNFFQYDSLKGLFINSIVLDNKNNLWAGSNNGLYRYNRLADNFNLIVRGYVHDVKFSDENIYFLLGKTLVKVTGRNNTKVVLNDKINTFFIEKDSVWYSPETGGLRLYGSKKTLLKNCNVSLIKKAGGYLFIACNNGNLYVKKSNKKIQKTDLLNHHKIFDVVKINNEYWVATDGNGIFVLNNNLNIKKHIYNKVNGISILPGNSIYNIFVSDDGVIWISSFGAGLACFLPENMPFRNLTPLIGNKNSLVAKEGYVAFIEREKYLLGTNYGFSEWFLKSNRFINHFSTELIKELKGTKIRGITKDRRENYWLATYDGVMGKYSKDMKLIRTYSPVNHNYEEAQKIVQLFNIDNDNFLIASVMRGKGLVLFNSQTGESSDVLYDKKNIRRKVWQIASIRKNQSDQIVILINHLGLFQYIINNNKLYPLTPEINKLLTMILNDFYQDKQGNYWIATKVQGLLKISPKGKILRKWSYQDGLPSNTILRLESLDDRYLWISTIDGLVRLDMATGKLQIFDSRHGLSTNEFSPRSSAKTPDNKIIFGCSEGFVIVNPSKVVVDTSKTKVIISDIVFQNTSIKKLTHDHYLKEPLEETKSLTLPFKRNSFTIKFFTKDNDLPKYNNFAYRLKGLENEWIYLGETNHTTYTNLSPGKYVFEVKSTNKSNVWNEKPTRLAIEILPPWYLTWWATVIYIILFLLGLFLILEYYKKRFQWKMELDMANYKAKHEHELTEKKLTFFTNISHDLKTAATLISAPVNDLLEAGSLNEKQIDTLKVVKRNAERLYKLNRDLLEFRKITQNQLPLKVSDVDLKPVVYNIFEAFSKQCEKNNIEYSISYKIEDIVTVDTKKVEKILWNLLSNAVKYTDKGGKITLNVRQTDIDEAKYIKLEVEDTGKGMSKEYLTKIFDRFYQVGKSETSLFGGVGIGLYIVKELVNIHHGEISVKSEPGKGSTFTVVLPAWKKFFAENEIAIDDNQVEPEDTFVSEQDRESDQKEQETATKKYNRPKVVIVEDNEDMRQYLFNHFSAENTVFVAENGKTGLDIVKKKDTDIVISDVKMPEMSGYELCDKIKNDFNTSHIPVILLTGNTSLDDKLKGMYAGADNYITKPFEIKYVDAVLKSLLVNRQKLRERFLGLALIKEETEKLSKQDIEFINNLKEFILQNLEEQNLNIDLLAKEFAMSRSQFNRKIKALTGITPNNFIKTLRLKKAYELLKDKNNRVADVAYQTGFSDPNYFTICFKKEFGENPSQVS